MPLDRYWSWNAAMREPEPDNADHMKWPIIPLVAMKLQIVVVYMHSGLFKLSSGDWTSGVALKYVVRDEYYGNALGLGAIDLLPDNVLHVSTWAIIIFQLLFSFLVYFPVKNNFFRALALLGASIMHIGFAIFLQVGLFPYLCATYLILLIPDQWLNGLLKKRRKRLSNIHVYYDADCGFCKATARLFGSFCLGPAAIIEPSYANKTADGLLKKHTSWVVMSPDKHYLKWEAVSFVLKQSPIFWIFGFLTDIAFIKPLMAKVYDSIGKNRHKLSKVFGSLLRKQVEHWPDVTQQTLCLICAVLMLAYTTMTIPQSPIVPPKSLYSFLAQLKLSQKWDLFAPNIASYDREFKISMTDKSGQDIDLLPILTQLYTQDEYGYKHFSTHKILRYFDALLRKNNPRHRLGFARYICNKTQNQNPDIVTMKIYFRHKFRKDDYYISNMVFSCDDIVTKGVSR